MKKAALTAALALLITLFVCARPQFATASYVRYALLLDDAPLCDENGNVLCLLPATYFVTLEEDGAKTRVCFEDVTGFVDGAKLERVDYEPVTKFPFRTARVENDGQSVNLKAAPQKNAATLASVPGGTTLRVYGPCSGEALYAGAATDWMYVRFGADEQSQVGYVYAPFLTVDALSPNVIEKVPEVEVQTEKGQSGENFSPAAKAVFVAALCLIAMIVMLAAFYRPATKRE